MSESLVAITGSRNSPEEARSPGPYRDPETILDLKSAPNVPLTSLPGRTLRLVSPEWSPGTGSANENKAARCLVLAISQKPGSGAPQHPRSAADQSALKRYRLSITWNRPGPTQKRAAPTPERSRRKSLPSRRR
ncbi:hypothetical protein SKAU_G00390360 [Synaphobranchus kaupii]|uniref:Uncharacterized protein n=1 Tax=Synaphobranchus kaupii TaxID=118154 RepID=A0A9Q1EBF4_SYNKA|nr:hypothetical protein SKAU_G00390360 [Synaphobranchus kaupii]